ncbi:hypothetical protein MTO96_007590 [Rhipicephalus appendiculatus]
MSSRVRRLLSLGTTFIFTVKQQSLGSTVGGLRSDRLISGGEAAKRAGGQSPSDGHSLAAASAGGADDNAELQASLQSSSAAAAAAVSAAVSAAAATAASSPASLLASLNAGAALLAARQSQQQHHQSPNLLLGSAFNAMEAARKHSLADSASPEPKRESRLTSIIDQLLINKTKDYLQQCSDLTKSTNHHNNSNDTSQSPALDPGTHSSQPSSPLSRNSAGTGAENTDRLDSDVSDRLSSSIASGSEEEPLATTGRLVVALIRFRSSSAIYCGPVNRALLAGMHAAVSVSHVRSIGIPVAVAVFRV